MAQHISVRVPWHDKGWEGCVCRFPERNQSCRVLRNIALQRSDASAPQCELYSGDEVNSMEHFIPPCLTESGQFMSSHEMLTLRHHPYVYDERFKHILDTKLSIPPFSFVGIPYKWTLKDKDKSEDSPNSRYYTGFDPSIEMQVTKDDSWITNGKNQRRIFEYFFRDVSPNESIVVAYAKAVPFVESPGRIIMGIGFVESVGELREYEYSEPPVGNLAIACLWERNIRHSIRADRKNGFLFPFTEIQAYLDDNPQQNPDDLVVIAPEEYRPEFSYATEHLSHDALIQTLNKTIMVLEKYIALGIPCGDGAHWKDCIEWCQAQLQKAWEERGAYPGLGAVLSALGVQYGFDVALALKKTYKDDTLWDCITTGLKNLSALLPSEQKGILRKITATQREDICDEIDERMDYLKLLSRITLTLPQAQLLLDDRTRCDRWLRSYADFLTDIHSKDLSADIIANPYLLYEKTYQLEEKYQIGIGKIDLAMFPPDYMVDHFFSSEENRVSEPDDRRRLRAIIVYILEREAANGSSIMLASDVVEAVGRFRTDVPNSESNVRLQSIQSKRRKDFFDELFNQFPIKVIPENGGERKETALQLVRLQRVDSTIRRFIDDRMDQYLDIHDDWNSLLKTVLNRELQSEEEREKAARKEKVEAIARMAQSRISILTGGAGTGKTTALAALCLNKSIQSEGILVLAPTGKARVVLSSKLRQHKVQHHTAKTLFQYLKSTNHCDIYTWSYYLSGKSDSSVPATVIIDECSMLTEEMLGALIEAVRGAKRVIFVGDPNQLPPIGTGKPFYELAQKMQKQEGQPHFAHLLVSNRQKHDGQAGPRLDVELAKLFTDDMAPQVIDDLFTKIELDKDNEKNNIEFIHCRDANSLAQAIETAFAKINITDVDSFDKSLGGEPNGQWMNFKDALFVENWQILSPYRNRDQIGTRSINAAVQAKYRIAKSSSRYMKRKTKHPMGMDGILYGEKVINVTNTTKEGYPSDDCQNYIANGEVGIVERLWEKPKDQKNKHQIRFSTQPEHCYKFSSTVSEDESPIELAYALTVHKAQGSGFRASIFVLMEPDRGLSPLVTREMLYTALTRQTDKVFIIYNKQPSEIRKYADALLSDLAHRKTYLFEDTILRQVKNGWYDSKNIFITVDGTRVKSKSEVIVYDLLYLSGKQPIYERELVLSGISVHPDYTLETPRRTVYWEHLGMLGDYNYRRDWEWKEKLYASHGITEENGNLILSRDKLTGAIDSKEIQSIINEKLD